MECTCVSLPRRIWRNHHGAGPACLRAGSEAEFLSGNDWWGHGVCKCLFYAGVAKGRRSPHKPCGLRYIRRRISSAFPPQHDCRVAPGGLWGMLCSAHHHHAKRARRELLPPRRTRIMLPENRRRRFFLDGRSGLRARLPASGGAIRARVVACGTQLGGGRCRVALRNSPAAAGPALWLLLLLRVPLSASSSFPFLRAIFAF
jgi:hypothetical protein